MKKLTKKFVKENTSISKVYASYGSTLTQCRFAMSEQLENRPDDRLFDNMLKWKWIVDIGEYTLTYEGLSNLRLV